MVDALRRAHRALKPRGILVDARPDATRVPRILAKGRIRARLEQTEDADQRDASSDRAVAAVKEAGLFRALESGRVWHVNTVGDLAALDDYARNSCRYEGYVRGDRAHLLPYRKGPLVLRRAIKFEVLERL